MSTTPKSVTQRYNMSNASRFQPLFATLDMMVMTSRIKPLIAMQKLRHLKTPSNRRLWITTLTVCFCMITTVLATTAVHAAGDSQKRWYRYYDDRGIPMISGSVSEQHMQHGYDVLDSTLNVLRHVPPFSTSRYDQEQAQRQQSIEKRIADRHTLETYVSSSRAMAQRDRELGDLDGQIKRGEQQSEGLTLAMNSNITSAASFERQGQPVPLGLRNQLAKNRTMLAQSETNVAALKAKRVATEQQFNKDIATLKRLEQQGSSATAPLPTSAE